MANETSIVRSAARFLSGTLISRITGLGRDMVMAWVFGASASVAAFMVAYRLANLLRRVVGEGAMQAAFVPQFEHLRAQEPALAAAFFRRLVFLVVSLLVVVVGATELLFWAVPASPEWEEVIHLAMWLMPGILFISLFGLFSSLLQCERRFFLTGVAPVMLNVVWVAAAFLLRDFSMAAAMPYLAVSVTLGFAAQWLLLVPAARPVWQLKGAHADWSVIKKMASGLGLGLIGVSAAQVNSALDALFARAADLQGPAWLWYAIRIQQLPLALFGIALANALLPALSRARAARDEAGLEQLLTDALRKTALLLIPMTFACFACGRLGIAILFEHGDFNAVDVEQTTRCLWAYAVGLFPQGVVLMVATGCYADKRFGLPAFASAASVVVNIGLNALLVFGLEWGAASIALATSLASMVNLAILLRGRLRPLFSKEALRVTLASLAALLAAWSITLPEVTVLQQLMAISLQGTIFLVVLLTLTFREMRKLF